MAQATQWTPQRQHSPQMSSPLSGNPPTEQALRLTINQLRYQLLAAQNDRERDRVYHEEAVRSMEAKVKSEGQRADAIESDQIFLFEKEKESNTTIENLRNEKDGLQKHFRNTINELRKDLDTEKDKNFELANIVDTLKSEKRKQKDIFEIESQTLVSTVDELKTALSSATERFADCSNQLSEEQNRVEQLRAELNAPRTENGENVDLQVATRELASQTAYARQLEVQNRKLNAEVEKLKSIRHDYGILREQNNALQNKVNFMDSLHDQMAELEIECSNLRDERDRWFAYIDRDETFDSPEKVIKALVAERAEKFALLDKTGRLEAENSSRTGTIADLEAQLYANQEKERSLQTQLQKQQQLLIAAECQKKLNRSEIQFLRTQLETYDSEEAIFMKTNYDEFKNKRLQQLQSLIDNQKGEIEGLYQQLKQPLESPRKKAALQSPGPGSKRPFSEENNVTLDESAKKDDLMAEASERIGRLVRRTGTLQESLIKAENEIADLKHQLEVSKKQLGALEKVNNSPVPKRRTRVLEFKNNPTARIEAIKQSTLDRLEKENQALLEQLKVDSDQKSVPIESIARLEEQIQHLEIRIAEKDKRLARFKEIWALKSLEFREAVFSLLGYQLDFLPNNKVRLTSVFAEALNRQQSNTEGSATDGTISLKTIEETSFMFDPEAGTMKLSGRSDSKFAAECENLIKFWVQERNEIPCFLAALNLELYEKRESRIRQ